MCRNNNDNMGGLSSNRITCLCVQAAPAYQVMDGFVEGGVDGYPSLSDLQHEGAELRESQELFELYVSDYVSLTRCKVRRLKSSLH